MWKASMIIKEKLYHHISESCFCEWVCVPPIYIITGFSVCKVTLSCYKHIIETRRTSFSSQGDAGKKTKEQTKQFSIRGCCATDINDNSSLILYSFVLESFVFCILCSIGRTKRREIKRYIPANATLTITSQLRF